MILEKIRQIYPHLTKSQRKLADFVANSYPEAAFMTASRLARHLSVNEATVIRFAQRLGYQGYPQMIRDVQAVLQEELAARDGAALGRSAGAAFAAGLKDELESLQRAASHVPGELVERLATALREAHRIYVTGQGASYHLAGMFAAGLAAIGLDGRMVAGEPEALAQALAGLRPGDLLVGIAVVRESPEVARAPPTARARGVHTLAVSGSPTSGTAQAAHLVLTCPPSEHSAALMNGVAAALLEALLRALAGVDPEGAKRAAAALDEAAQAVRGDDA